MLETISEQRCFGGTQGFYSHQSECTGTTMRFAVYVPAQAVKGPVAALYYLAGLTCTEETATIKAGAQRLAAEAGLVLVMPDTSPRGAGVAGEDDDWDFGSGAGFYLDATAPPWSTNYRMYSYITEELSSFVAQQFPVDTARVGVFGHSMGGHGALTIALKNPDKFRSVSAFAPICAPRQCAWGEKAFSNYLGSERSQWAAYDATFLVESGCKTANILIDQGQDDQFLDEQLKPQVFRAACESAGQPLQLRTHPGYDHSYYFIASFMPDHIAHHAALLDA
jgi:S-formylglutathione hydrolase